MGDRLSGRVKGGVLPLAPALFPCPQPVKILPAAIKFLQLRPAQGIAGQACPPGADHLHVHPHRGVGQGAQRQPPAVGQGKPMSPVPREQGLAPGGTLHRRQGRPSPAQPHRRRQQRPGQQPPVLPRRTVYLCHSSFPLPVVCQGRPCRYGGGGPCFVYGPDGPMSVTVSTPSRTVKRTSSPANPKPYTRPGSSW